MRVNRTKQEQKLCAMRVNDFCATIGIGRTKAYELINEGKLTAITIAGRTLIPASEVDRLIAEAMAEAKKNEANLAGVSSRHV